MFLAYLGADPIGYIQVYRVMGADPEWWTEETDPGARGIDQFLANAEQLGQGLGSSMVRQFVARLVRRSGGDAGADRPLTRERSRDSRLRKGRFSSRG